MVRQFPVALLQSPFHDGPGRVWAHLADRGHVGAVGHGEAVEEVGDVDQIGICKGFR